MIVRIALAGIKSFVDPVEVPCRQLTIISGANSAGKSTILQTLLLLKQTWEAVPVDSSIRLSGALANLGTAAIATTEAPFITVESSDREVSLELEKDSGRDGDKLFIKSLSVGPHRALLSKSPEDALINFQAERLLLGDIYDFENHWIVLRGITPIVVIRRVHGFSTEQRLRIDTHVTRYLVDVLTDLLESGIIDVDGYEERQFRTTALSYLGQKELAHGIRVMRQIKSVADEMSERVTLPDELRSMLSETDVELISEIGQLLDLDHFSEVLSALVSKDGVPTFELIHDVSKLEQLSLQQLTDSVLYLGPLREDPRLIHEDLVLTDVADIGPKGRHMVPYLYYCGQNLIEARLPSYLKQEEHNLEKVRLLEAINAWLRHLEIGYELIVEQRQPYGLIVSLKSHVGGSPQLLTNVGVGVSQVLPILTVGLAAKRGQTLIYEQPELHLHPAVQSKLADFFLILAVSGIQVIVETHSEHLINRARLYVARRQLDPSALCIVFVRRDEEGSSVETIDIDDDGYLASWPDGFFDETEKTLLEILR